MRVVELNPLPRKIPVSTSKDKTIEQKIFDLASLHKVNPDLIKNLFVDAYKKHLETVTALVVSRIALNSAMSDAEKHIAQTTSNGNTAPVQINTEDNIEMMDTIFAKALREYAVNASAEIAIANPEIRKEYVNNYNTKSPLPHKVSSIASVGVRKSRSELEEEHMNGIDRVAALVDQKLGKNTDNNGPYGAINKEPHNGKLPVVRQSIRNRSSKV